MPQTQILRRRRREGDTKLHAVAELPLFARCQRNERQAVAASATDLSVDAGVQLAVEGRHRSEVLVLVGGRADLSRDGRKFAELGPGDLVGELEAISRMPAPATVTTTAPTRVLAIWDAEFRELLRNHPAIAAAVLEAVASRQARAA